MMTDRFHLLQIGNSRRMHACAELHECAISTKIYTIVALLHLSRFIKFSSVTLVAASRGIPEQIAARCSFTCIDFSLLPDT